MNFNFSLSFSMVLVKNGMKFTSKGNHKETQTWKKKKKKQCQGLIIILLLFWWVVEKGNCAPTFLQNNERWNFLKPTNQLIEFYFQSRNHFCAKFSAVNIFKMYEANTTIKEKQTITMIKIVHARERSMVESCSPNRNCKALIFPAEWAKISLFLNIKYNKHLSNSNHALHELKSEERIQNKRINTHTHLQNNP